MAPRHVGQGARENGEQSETGEVVVGERRMAGVGGEKDLVRRLAGQEQLAVGQGSLGEGRVDDDFVLAVRQRFEGAVGQAEAPVSW